VHCNRSSDIHTALKFDPDRFIDDRLHKYLTPNPFIFLPFNAGPRICLGQQVSFGIFAPLDSMVLSNPLPFQFAYNEISFFLVRLLQNFHQITLAPDAQPATSLPPKGWAKSAGFSEDEKVWPKSHLTMYIRVSVVLCLGGLLLTLIFILGGPVGSDGRSKSLRDAVTG
jgi:hypothetical protein